MILRPGRPLSLRALAAVLGTVFLSACGAGGGGDHPSPTAPPTPVTPSSGVAVVQFGPSVDAATRAHSVTFVGLVESTPTTGSGLLTLPDTAPAAVLAVNAVGEAILGGFASGESTATVDATSTAHLIVYLLLPGPHRSSPDAVRAAVAAQPGFAAVVDAVTGSATKGAYFGSPGAIQAAAAVASQVARSQGVLPPVQTRLTRPPTAGAASSRAAAVAGDVPAYKVFTKLDVALGPKQPAGGSITVTNNAFVPLITAIAPAAADSQLRARRFCIMCWPPLVQAASDSRAVTLGDGEANLGASFGGGDARTAFAVQVGLDVVSAAMQASGISGVENDASFYLLRNNLATILNVKAAQARDDFPGMLAAVKDAAVANTPAIVDLIVQDVGERYAGKKAKAEASRLILRNLMRLVGTVETAAWVAERALVYKDVATYWSAEDEKVPGCFEAGTYHEGGCVAKIVLPSGTSEVEAGQKAVLEAKLYDKDGVQLSGREVKWSLQTPSDEATLTVEESGHSLTTLTGVKDGGPVVVVAEAGPVGARVKKTVSVRVGVDLTGYALEVLEYHPSYAQAAVRTTLKPRDAFETPNRMAHLVRLTYEGKPVTQGIDFVAAHVFGYRPDDRPPASGTFYRFPFGPDDHRDSTYRVVVVDAVRQRTIAFPLNITLSNAGYRAFAGRTLTVYQAKTPEYAGQAIFSPDGTLRTVRVQDGFAYTGTYQLATGEYTQWYVAGGCEGPDIPTRSKAIIGAVGPITFPIHPLVGVYIWAYGDGTFGFNSNLSCPVYPGGLDDSNPWVVR